jgi:hypothetical protein
MIERKIKMINLEYTEVSGWRHAIRGMRNPKNSWHLSDTIYLHFSQCRTKEEAEIAKMCGDVAPIIGENDLALMNNLAKAGTDHRKFLRMLTVYVDITAPLYWWKEFDTYKVGTVANSCSTMHKIHAKAFELEDFSHEHLFDGIEMVEGDSDMEYYENPTTCLEYTISVMEHYRKKYMIATEKLKRTDLTTAERRHTQRQQKAFWYQMIQLLPTSYNQRRTIMFNYEVLANMYKSRKHHKLTDWHTLCDWIESLPYSFLITGEVK